MPEVLAILFVLLASVGTYLFAVLQVARAGASEDVPLKLKEWRERQAWVEERLQKARAEKWDADMIGSLLTQHTTALAHVRSLEHQLAKTAAPAPNAEESAVS